MPALEPVATLCLAAQDLIAAIKNLNSAPIDLNPKYTAALRQLAEIFKDIVVEKDDITEEQPVPRVNNTPVPRVNTPSTSHDPTAPRVLRAQPRVHQRKTRNNTPIPTIHEESKQAMQRTRRRVNRQANKENASSEANQQKKKKRTIAEYQRQSPKKLRQHASHSHPIHHQTISISILYIYNLQI
eukprot:scaffold82313_cov39-Cyclotella_meneghiniana.AAC.3